MNQDNSDTILKENILNKIKTEEVKMTPRQVFVRKWATMFVMSMFFLLLGMYILAYVIFLFVDNGLIYIPLFTETGVVDFVVEVPWTLVFLGLVSVFLFSVTSKTFYKIYRKPFLTFFFSILMIIVLSHLILLETGGMQYLKEEAYRNKIQLAPAKLLQFRSSQTGKLYVGYIVSTSSNSVIIRDRNNQLLEIIPENTIDLNKFIVGQLINAYGQKDSGQVRVKSIEIIK